jgi:hypothetical protein
MKVASGSGDMNDCHGAGKKLIPSFPNLVASTWPGTCPCSYFLSREATLL